MVRLRISMFIFNFQGFFSWRSHKLFWDGHMSVNTSVSHKNFGKHVIWNNDPFTFTRVSHSSPSRCENVHTVVSFCFMSNSNSTFCNQLHAGESECHQEFIPGDSWFVFIWLVYISTFKRGIKSIMSHHHSGWSSNTTKRIHSRTCKVWDIAQVSSAAIKINLILTYDIKNWALFCEMLL